MKSLPLRNKVLYSFGSVGSSAVFFSTTLWLVFFYSPPPESGRPVLVPIFIVGLVLAIGRFIEAFDDPLIGHWSDVTKSRWGRRASFIMFGMPFMALFFFLLWSPPHNNESLVNAVYFFIVLEGFYLFATVVLGPYEAMLPELAVTAEDRVSVASWKVFFGTAGTSIALVASPYLVNQFGFRTMGVALAAIALVAIYIGLLGGRGHLRFEHQPADIPFMDAVKATLSNPPFLAFSAGLVLFYVGFNLLIQVMPFFVVVVMEETEEKVAWFTGAILLMLVLSLPAMVRLARWRTKKWAYAAGMLALVFYMPLWYFAGFLPEIPKLVQGIVYVTLSGIPFAALFVFPNALMADVIDYDELRTGQRREAIYYGMQETLKKASLALSTGLFVVVLNLGFSTENPLGIRLMGPVAAVAVLAGFALFTRGYQLPDTVRRPDQEEARRGE